MVGSADIGEIIMRAFILRRMGLWRQARGRRRLVLVGVPRAADLTRLEGFPAATDIATCARRGQRRRRAVIERPACCRAERR